MQEDLPPEEVTRLLKAWNNKDQEALEQLMPMVYDGLYRMASLRFSGQANSHTLQPTALISEFYLRLIGRKNPDWQNRAHFFGIAAGMMRQILIDHARKHNAAKRGDGVANIPIAEMGDVGGKTENLVDLLALDDALNDLKTMDEQQCQIVELRFFAGLSTEETAEVLEVSERTVKRKWAAAKAWLYNRLNKK